MKLVIDLSSNTVVGGTTDDEFKPSSNQVLIEAPEDSEVVTIPAADLQPIMKENALMETYLYKKTSVLKKLQRYACCRAEVYGYRSITSTGIGGTTYRSSNCSCRALSN